MTGARKRGVWVLLIAVALFGVFVVPQVLEKGDKGDGAGRSAQAAGVALGVPRATDAPGGSKSPSGGSSAGEGLAGGGSSGGDASGGEASGGGEQDDKARGEAFAAARAGDCLALFDTGDGWNTRIPQKVGCSGDAGLTRVSAVRTGWSACPTGDGLSYVVHRSAAGKRVLCLTRQYKAGYCVLAEKSTGRGAGGTAMRLGAMTAVDCGAERTTPPYNTVLHITGVYGPSSGRAPGNCRRAPDDRTFYWSWQVDGGGTLLCTMVYRR
ncbi:hypothetical protein ACH4SP_23850 [Streptomyces sp. NPDC021093]|uniref:hypothetical protein n=1 Tax=Streptomyces sp. NPDC021093 TaxID=3365112 RepID=UPI003788610E